MTTPTALLKYGAARRPRKQATGIAAADIDRVVEIERLAALDPIDYEIARAEAAKRLGMRASILDRAVAKKRHELGLETEADDDGQGRAVKIADPLPWPEPVDGGRLATTLAAAAITYLVLSDAAADVIALWVMHTWIVNAFTMSPRLAIVSPTKGCGKTTLLRLLNHIARRAKRAGSISPSALFRAVEQFQPTVLLDETEKYIEHGSDLHALLNEGHCKGGSVWRVLGEKKLELREFSIFGAVAFARNGRLPDDLEQRSIVIEMQRRRADEKLAELRDDRSESLRQIARMCARWADDCAGSVADADPDIEMINRNRDNWRPLFVIADVIGSDWPERIREAAAVLAPRESETIGIMLLADLKGLFEQRSADRLASGEICDALAAMEGRPWAEWKASKVASPKPITKNQLAQLLKPFHIVSDSVRIGDHTPKGYYLHQFTEAFDRYLSPEGVSETQHRNKPTATSTSATFRNATDTPDVAFHKCEKPLRPSDCCGVAVQKGDGGTDDANGEVWPLVCEHCGRPERPDAPVQSYNINDRDYLLHPRCQKDWFDGPDPDGWTFNLDSSRDTSTAQTHIKDKI
jgi:putative DNA primase/helicase